MRSGGLLACTDFYGPLHREEKDSSVADLSGIRCITNFLDDHFGIVITDDDIYLYLWDEVDGHRPTPVLEGDSLLVPPSHDLRYGHPIDSLLLEDFLDKFKPFRPDYRFHHLHGIPLSHTFSVL